VKKVSQIIRNTDGQLSRLMTTENTLVKIKNELAKVSIFETHCNDYRLIKFSQGILYLSVSTPAFAMQLRHTTPQIMRELQDKLPEIGLVSIQCKVSTFSAPTLKPSVYKKIKTKVISDRTRTKLTKLSETIGSEELSKALKRLGQR